MLGPLQTGGATVSGPQWLRLLIQGSDVVGALLGLVIAYIAYRGYRRNRSRPMLFVAVGFVLALGVPLAFLLVTVAVPSLPRLAVAAFAQASELAGLLCIIYGLRVRP
jgi:hypothetical protein